MEGKKLNIEFAENEAGAIGEDNTLSDHWDHFDNQLESWSGQQSADNVAVTQNDIQVNVLKGRLAEMEIKASVFEDKENLYKDKIKYMDDLIAALKLSIESSQSNGKEIDSQIKTRMDEIKLLENDALIKDYKNQIEAQNSTIQSLKKDNEDLSSKVKELENKKKHNKILTIIQYGTAQKYMIVPGIKPFEPTLEHKVAGAGWLVIQRRIDGKVDFQTSYEAYVNGFGDPKGELWLGLERLHHITSYQQHELYIRIIDFDNKPHYARYDNFVVGSQKEKYELKSLGKYVGDANDIMRLNEKKTFLVDPIAFKNGWWWYVNAIPNCNLNGKFTKTIVKNQEYMFWGLKEWGNKGNYIQSVQMLIRPKENKLKIKISK